MSDVMLGIGLSTGHFFHAPEGTAFPNYPAETLSSAWKKVGDVTQDGITLTTDKSTELLKNWANVIKRVILSDHSETIQAPIMDTTEEALKTVLGEDNVTVVPANSSHGELIKAELSSSERPPAECFLFLMKDGDAKMVIVVPNGQISEVGDVVFKAGEAVGWPVTLSTAPEEHGPNSYILTDDGQVITDSES